MTKHVLWVTVLAASGSAFAQQQEHASADSAARAPLIPGLGKLHHPVSTSSPEAQRYFDQGLTLIYAFNHEEAARSFTRATELDSGCAMCYWGIALAVGPNYNDPEIDPDRQKAAVQAIGKALEPSIKAPENEQAYINALAKRYSTDPKADVKKLGLDYKMAMGDVARRYPDDLDAATLYAESAMDLRPWQLWTADGQPAEGTPEIIDTLKSVLRRDPEHIGANHYYIHATEASPHPEQAAESARRLAGLAPAAGHLVHMPSHLYIRVGDYHAASVANEKAAAADRDYIAKYHVSGMYAAMYYSHNLHFLAVSSSMEGRFAEADAAAKELEARVTPFVAQMPMAEWFVPTRMFVLVRFRKWTDVETLPEPAASLRLAHAFWRFGRGMAASGTGKLERAESDSAAMKKEVEAIPADAHMGLNSAHQLLEIAGGMLDANIARAKGDYRRSAGLLRKASRLEDALNYDEPPDWYLPARESLGAVLIADHKLDEAEAAFRQELKAHPNNPRALFGLAQCLKAEGRKADEKQTRADFDAGWKYADTRLRADDL